MSVRQSARSYTQQAKDTQAQFDHCAAIDNGHQALLFPLFFHASASYIALETKSLLGDTPVLGKSSYEDLVLRHNRCALQSRIDDDLLS